MFKSSKLVLAGCSVLALSACGGLNLAGPPTVSEEEEAARVYSNDVGDFGGAIEDGMVLSARQIAMAGIHLNYDTGETEITEVSEFRVQQNDDGEFTLWLNGTEWAFVAEDRVTEDGESWYFTQARCDDEGVCVSLWSATADTIDELATGGNGYHEIVQTQNNQVNDGQPDLRAYAAIGAETHDDDLGSLGTATYFGRARVDAYPTTGFENNGESRTNIRSDDVMMSADFGAGTISGVMDDFRIRNPGDEDYADVAGTMVMEETSFIINGFAGTLSADATLAQELELNLDSGTYSGVFFGDEAQAIGGVLSVTGTGSEIGEFNGVGYFTGDQDD